MNSINKTLYIPLYGKAYVISERKRYYQETDDYKMLCADVRSPDWLLQVPPGNAIVVMEGVSMYLSPDELRQTMTQIASRFFCLIRVSGRFFRAFVL